MANGNDVVIIKLDRERMLRLGHNALKLLEELTGKSTTELDESMNLMDHDLREKITYCGLLKDAKEHGETLSLEQMPDLLDEAPSLRHVMEAIVRAWRVAFGAPQTEGGEVSEGNQGPAAKPAKEKASTGMRASE